MKKYNSLIFNIFTILLFLLSPGEGNNLDKECKECKECKEDKKCKECKERQK